jgi:tetratricopeptide (TPR) repeat protein
MISQQLPTEADSRASGWVQHWRTPGICLVLAAITFAVFGQTLRHGFVNFDDDAYVYENTKVAGGLSLKGLDWVFTHADCDLYHPLTMLSLMADYQLHGLQPGGYHFTNVLLHTASVILLFLILRQMTGALWRSAFVAAVFAIHPLRVESVAWVAERKDMLGGFFFMLTLGAYVRYVRKPESPARYLMVAAAFVLALLSKPTMVTLPFVLLFLDYWPLHRFEQPRKLSGLILEKIPLLALAAGACAMTVLAAGKFIAGHADVPMTMRIGNALDAYAIYLRQMVWPEGLAASYPFPYTGLEPWKPGLAVLLLAGLSALAFWQRRKQPWLLSGWLWYLAMLLPMAGLIQVGRQAHADRYTYLPQIGIYVALTWLAAEWGAKWQVSRAALAGLMTALLAVLMVCAWKQTAYWQNSETLWTHALACTARNDVAHYMLGQAVILQKERRAEAMAHFEQALEINAVYEPAQYSLGVALLQLGRVDEAIPHLQSAVHLTLGDADPCFNLGNALLQKGRVDEAIAQYQQVVDIRPDYAEAHNNLGYALLQKGRVDEALTHCQQAVQISPDIAEAHNNLGNALCQKGRVDEAISQFQRALQINPATADALNNLGNALLQKGRVDEAIGCYQKALAINPGYAVARDNLGKALLQKQRNAVVPQ